MMQQMYEDGWNDALKSKEVRAMLAALKAAQNRLLDLAEPSGSKAERMTMNAYVTVSEAIAQAEAAGIKRE